MRLSITILAIASTLMFGCASPTDSEAPLITIDLPSPLEMRPGWALQAARSAARGWTDDGDIHADCKQWFFHDGGGNWAALRFYSEDKIVLLGNDHEYSNTYFGSASEYFDEEETDILAGAPDWWSFNLSGYPFEDWIGFIYGWDGERWQRAAYDVDDGFKGLDLLGWIGLRDTQNTIKHFWRGDPFEPNKLEYIQDALKAEEKLTAEQFERLMPGKDTQAALAAMKKFYEAPMGCGS